MRSVAELVGLFVQAMHKRTSFGFGFGFAAFCADGHEPRRTVPHRAMPLHPSLRLGSRSTDPTSSPPASLRRHSTNFQDILLFDPTDKDTAAVVVHGGAAPEGAGLGGAGGAGGDE